MTSKWFEEKENLEHLILIDKLSYEEIGRRYGCTGSNIKKVAKRIGINLPQKRRVNVGILTNIVQMNVRRNINIKLAIKNY